MVVKLNNKKSKYNINKLCELFDQGYDIQIQYEYDVYDDLDKYCHEYEWYNVERIDEELEQFDILVDYGFTVRDSFNTNGINIRVLDDCGKEISYD